MQYMGKKLFKNKTSNNLQKCLSTTFLMNYNNP